MGNMGECQAYDKQQLQKKPSVNSAYTSRAKRDRLSSKKTVALKPPGQW
jgi:hypothetical protein